MANYRQTNAGGSVGATITAGSGGSADGSTPYDAVSVGASGTGAYDTTHTIITGVPMIKFATGASAVPVTASLSTSITFAVPDYSTAVYYLTAFPAAQIRLLTLFAGATAILGLNLTTTGKLQVSLPISATVATTTASVPLNAPWRGEMALLALSATVGQGEVRLFGDAFTSTLVEAPKQTAATGNSGTTTPDRIAIGLGTGVANVSPFWGTYLQKSTTGYPPPPIVPPRQLARPTLQQVVAVNRSALF